MQRDIFRRPTRMTHKFGETENLNDPLGSNTFDPKFPMVGKSAHKGESISIQQQGMYEVFTPARSPVQTPSGRLATINGPAPDWAEAIGAPISPTTKKRVGHLKTDK